jgi:hypothetical protein
MIMISISLFDQLLGYRHPLSEVRDAETYNRGRPSLTYLHDADDDNKPVWPTIGL